MNISESDFLFVADLVHNKSGICLTEQKHYLVESRLLPIIRKHGFKDLNNMVANLQASPDREIQNEIIEAITTNETSFFRDITPFTNFEKEIIPRLAESPKNKIRVWSSACSSGQEAYSIAITLVENKHKLAGKKFEIFASDINRAIVGKAREAVYSQFDAQRGLSVTTLMKYFDQVQDCWALRDEIKSMVEFDIVNLMDDFSNLGEFDVIFCRNVLIYFDDITKKQVLEKIAGLMSPASVLFLGSAENPAKITDKFKPYKRPVNGIYKLS